MAGSLTIIFWILFIFGCYFYYKYSSSRNKTAYLKKGVVRSFLYSLGILLGLGILLSFLLPNEPVNLSYFKLTSETISDRLSFSSGLIYYLYKTVEIFTEINLLGLLCAGLVFGIWLYYVRSLDFFKKEKISSTILTVATGILCTFLIFPISDFITELLNISYSENTFYNLFIYCFIKIGIPEEFVKTLPVFIILIFTKEVDEPIDLVYYASLSALGFAFIENLIYLRDISGATVVGRAVTAVVGHMIDTSIVAYGIIIFKFRSKQNLSSLRYILFYFLLGSFMHALYDYLLFENLFMLFAGFFILSAQVWFIFINNAINNSRFFNYSIPYKHEKVKFKMIMSLVALILIGFILDGFNLGRDKAIGNYIATLGFCGPLIAFYASEASSFDLFKGHWRKFKFTLKRPSENSMPSMRGWSTLTKIYTDNIIVPINHVGKKIKIHCHQSNHELSQYLYIDEGKIVGRIKLQLGKSEDIDWFLVKLKNPFLNFYTEFNDSYILIKFKNKHHSLDHDTHILCWLKLIPKDYKFKACNPLEKFTSFGTIVINGHDYEYQ